VKRIYHAHDTGCCNRERGFHPKVEGRVVRLRVERCDMKIDRSTPWGNPFVIGKHGDRHEVIERFRMWALTSADPEAVWIREHVHELRGKVLGCWCAPLDCHGFVLLEMAMSKERHAA
jgi:hypothetical protein